MCGIVGIIAHETRLAPEVLERATASLAHRGPDDSGTVIVHAPNSQPLEIGLGNRRLAILDLSPLGHQPMQDPSTGNWIVYNGEIYNFREIRTKLERLGIIFRSNSDTEVLLHAYARWGLECLTALRGMFAFALWDARAQQLVLARDPMGIKPLYYASTDQYFLFASELRTLLGTDLIPRKLSLAGLSDYLMFGSVYEPNTIVDGIRALGAGCHLTWKDGTLREQRYWDLLAESHQAQGTKANFAQDSHTDSLPALLEESVNLQMVSDVPVGVFLSGGIDSSSLVALLSENGNAPHTFSIVFREADYSEAEFSRLVARTFATDHHEIVVSQGDALEAIPNALQSMDQPTMDGINTFVVSQFARAAGVKVVLSGLGGDEVFAGYSSFRTVPRMENFVRWWNLLPRAARVGLADTFSRLSPVSDQTQKLTDLARANGDLPHPYFLTRMLFTSSWRQRLLIPPAIEAGASTLSRSRAVLDHIRVLDTINRVSYLESRCYMLNTLLRDSDSMSMAHGLEVRVPLIDHLLAARVLAIPGPVKLDSHTPKPLLVHSLKRRLPDVIVHRKKRGFTLPFEHWLRDDLRESVGGSLGDLSAGPLRTALQPDSARQVWNAFQNKETSWSRPWSLHVLDQWCRRNGVAGWS